MGGGYPTVAHFQLVTVDGVSLNADTELGHPNWPVGSVIFGCRERNLRVVDVIPPNNPEEFAILVVEDAG